MVRTINLRPTLTKIAPELSRRLAASHLCDFTGRLVIADLREQVALDISGGRVSVAERTPSAGSAIRGGEQIAHSSWARMNPSRSSRPPGSAWPARRNIPADPVPQPAPDAGKLGPLLTTNLKSQHRISNKKQTTKSKTPNGRLRFTARPVWRLLFVFLCLFVI